MIIKNYLKEYYSGVATIFLLHRVFPLEKGNLWPNEKLKVSPGFLEEFIIKAKRKGYRFIDLDRLADILINQERSKNNIVITLDDGYSDLYDYAYPIFKKHQIPFCIYLSSSFPDKKAILWWYDIEDLITQNSSIKLSGNLEFKCNSTKEKIKTFNQVRQIILNIPPIDLLIRLDDLFKNYNIDWYRKVNDLACNWDQILEMSKDPLCTIASHSENHLRFNQLSSVQLESEILNGINSIEAKIGSPLKHFSYPFGGENEVNQREYDLVKKLGIVSATTTRKGNVFLEHKDYLNCLPRIMLTEDFRLSKILRIRKNRIQTL